MDIRDQISVNLNTAWKRRQEGTPYSGHGLVEFGYWSRTDGFVQKDKAQHKGGTYLAIPCPVIAIVDTKIREDNLILNINSKVTELFDTEDFDQIGVQITKKRYKGTQTDSQTTLTIPRLTRTGAVFLVSGLGNNIWQITSVASNLIEGVDHPGGKVTFYGLASEGSKILYYLGMYNLHNTIKQIINGIWIAPEKCPTCNGTGIWREDDCPQCLTYKYSGTTAERGVAIAKGYDVGISRTKFLESDYPLNNVNWAKVWKFINKAWTQKWWTTPTLSEIKRMFAHFYNVGEDSVRITERYHFSMPHWDVLLPIQGAIGSPFEAGDDELMKFIAESVTPAGVNVFVGFYQLTFIGDLDSLQDSIYGIIGEEHVISKMIFESSTGQYYGLWKQRYRFWNGWSESVDNFEGNLSKWSESGVVSIQNSNDIGRNWCRLGDDSSITTVTGLNISNATGTVELWIHPNTSNFRIGAYLTGVDQWAFYVDFRDSGFYDNNGSLLEYASFKNDYHLSIDFISDVALTGYGLGYIENVRVNKNVVGSDIPYVNPLAPNRPFRVNSSGVGTGFVDNFGGDWIPGYTINDNWQRLYPWGWGKSHNDNISGVINLYEKYFRKDKFIGVTGI